MFSVYDNLGEAVQPYSSEQFSCSRFPSKPEAVTYAKQWFEKGYGKIRVPGNWDGSRLSFDKYYIEINEE